jgi:O-antigen/teichoic acid export membrane protein
MLTVAIVVVFVPRYGFIACAWASFTSNFAMMLLSYFIGQKKFPVPYNLRSALFHTVVAAGCYAAAMLPAIESTLLRLTYRTALLLIFITVVFLTNRPRRLHHL